MFTSTVTQSIITNIGKLNDKTNISETRNPIFTLQNESSTSFASHNGYDTNKQQVAKSCQCSKSTARKLCEYPRENLKTKFTNTHDNSRKAIDESKPSLQKMKNSDNSRQIEVADKEKGCHWTCGTKMFSKSEKVLKLKELKYIVILYIIELHIKSKTFHNIIKCTFIFLEYDSSLDCHCVAFHILSYLENGPKYI